MNAVCDCYSTAPKSARARSSARWKRRFEGCTLDDVDGVVAAAEVDDCRRATTADEEQMRRSPVLKCGSGKR